MNFHYQQNFVDTNIYNCLAILDNCLYICLRVLLYGYPKVHKEMTIPKQKRDMYGELREHGDVSKLSRLTGLTRVRIYAILEGGKCPASAATKINAFYRERKKEVQSILQDND